MNPIFRIAVPVLILGVVGYSISSMLSTAGSSMAEQSVQAGIASQVRYHQGTIKDGESCADFKTRIGQVSSPSDYAAQLIALSNEARAAGCLK